jgi:serine O-acetyltransferase
MFENLRDDLRHARRVNSRRGSASYLKILLQPGTMAVVSHRFYHWVLKCKVPVVRQVLLLIAAGNRYFIEIISGVHLTPQADLGPGFVVHTPEGVFVGPVRIGQHGVVISYGTLGVGDDCWFGAGAKVFGNTRIGNNVVVMPNSLVMTDVPDNLTVLGVPARIRWRRGNTLKFAKAAPTNGPRPAPPETAPELEEATPFLNGRKSVTG